MNLDKLKTIEKNICYETYFKKDEWLIIEEGFHPEMNRESERYFR